MKPGSTGGTWEVRWEDDDHQEGTVFRIIEVNGVAMPKKAGRIYRGDAARRRREEAS